MKHIISQQGTMSAKLIGIFPGIVTAQNATTTMKYIVKIVDEYFLIELLAHEELSNNPKPQRAQRLAPMDIRVGGEILDAVVDANISFYASTKDDGGMSTG